MSKISDTNGLTRMLVLLTLPVWAAACGGAGAEEGGEGEEVGEGERTETVREGDGTDRYAGEAADAETVSLTVPAGTSFRIRLDGQLSTEDNQVGDRFTATTVGPLTAGGSVAVPEGATIHGGVTAVQHSEGATQPAVLKVAFQEIEVGGESYPIEATLTEANPEVDSRTSTAEGAAKVGAGAAAGAIIGRIIGGDAKGTLIGAAVGAAAGTAIVLGTSDADAVLPEGSEMTLRLDQPLTVERERQVASGGAR